MVASWEEMRSRLLARVFYEFSPDEVEASTHLVGDGFLNSLSILVVLGLLEDELGGHSPLIEVAPSDTSSLATIEALYRRLLQEHQIDEVS